MLPSTSQSVICDLKSWIWNKVLTPSKTRWVAGLQDAGTDLIGQRGGCQAAIPLIVVQKAQWDAVTVEGCFPEAGVESAFNETLADASSSWLPSRPPFLESFLKWDSRVRVVTGHYTEIIRNWLLQPVGILGLTRIHSTFTFESTPVFFINHLLRTS